MASSTQTYVLPAEDKLDGTNYSVWSFLIMNLLIAKDLWDIVTGVETRPPFPAASTSPTTGTSTGQPSSSTSTSTTTAAPTDEQKRFDQRNAMALYLICLSIKSSLIVNIRHIKSAKEAWDTLALMYDVKNTARIMALRNELQALKMLDSDKVTPHLNKFKNIIDQLRHLNDNIDEAQVVEFALNSLASSFENFVTSLLLDIRTAPISFQELTGLILQEEQRKVTFRQAQQTAEAVAYAARHAHATDSSSNTSGGQKKKGKCGYCKKPGHYYAECRKRLAKEKKESGTSSSTSAPSTTSASAPASAPPALAGLVVHTDPVPASTSHLDTLSLDDQNYLF